MSKSSLQFSPISNNNNKRKNIRENFIIALVNLNGKFFKHNFSSSLSFSWKKIIFYVSITIFFVRASKNAVDLERLIHVIPRICSSDIQVTGTNAEIKMGKSFEFFKMLGKSQWKVIAKRG
jgi:hypothetical protein